MSWALSLLKHRWATSVLLSATLVGISMWWTGESPIREAVQEPLSWLMVPGIAVGFAVGEYGGHDFQWPYLIGGLVNFALYSVLFFCALTLISSRRHKQVRSS